MGRAGNRKLKKSGDVVAGGAGYQQQRL